MATRRDRRKSGYRMPHSTIPLKDLDKYCLFIGRFYDDWSDWRDGQRDCFRDFKLIKRIRHMHIKEVYEKRKMMNGKQKRFLRIRKARKPR